MIHGIDTNQAQTTTLQRCNHQTYIAQLCNWTNALGQRDWKCPLNNPIALNYVLATTFVTAYHLRVHFPCSTACTVRSRNCTTLFKGELERNERHKSRKDSLCNESTPRKEGEGTTTTFSLPPRLWSSSNGITIAIYLRSWIISPRRRLHFRMQQQHLKFIVNNSPWQMRLQLATQSQSRRRRPTTASEQYHHSPPTTTQSFGLCWNYDTNLCRP